MFNVIETDIGDICSEERLNFWFTKQRERKKPIYYLLPLTKWLFQARKIEPGLAYKTFDDLAKLMLEKAGVSYLSLSEHERTLFFQQFLAETDLINLSSKEEEHYQAMALADTYGQLKRLYLSTSELPESLAGMKELFERYEQWTVKERNMLDPENMIVEATVAQLKKQLHIEAVVVDGYFDFNPLQYAMLERLVAEKIPVTIYLPTIDGLPLFTKTKQYLSELGFSIEEKAKQASRKATDVYIQTATTKEEEILAIFESLIVTKKNVDEVALVIVDEKDRRVIERLAKKRQLPLQQATTLAIHETAVVSFLKAFLAHNGHFETKWDLLALFEPLTKLLCFRSEDYVREKHALLTTGELKDESLKRLFHKLERARATFKQEMSFVTYIEQTLALLESLQLDDEWRKQLEEVEETEHLKKVSIEAQALEKLLHLLETKANALKERELEDFMLHRQIYQRWLTEEAKKTHLYVERGTRSGLAIYSLREVALFRGKHLYVIGMNDKLFPKRSTLAGYFQERDLHELRQQRGLPTNRYVRAQQDAQFEQLFYLAETVTFSYVKGTDEEHPLLPSPYLAEIEHVRGMSEYHRESRLKNNYYFSEEDYLEKVAYHLGLGYSLEEVPEQLQRIKARFARLKSGEETIGDQLAEELASDRVAITALESYASCPFRYGVSRLLEAHEPEMLESDVSPLSLGNMLHSLIEAFYKKMNALERPFSQLSEEEKSKAFSILLELFHEKWEELEKTVPTISRFDLALHKSAFEKRLRKWWAAERKMFWDNEKLANMEIWKLEEQVSYSLTDGERSLLLLGKIDRIDRDEAGFVVYDYKSGEESFQLEKEMKNGLKLQLPIYLAAVEERLKKSAYGASYISFKSPDKRTNNGMWLEKEVGQSSRFHVTHHCKNRVETFEAERFFETYQLKETIFELATGMSKQFPVKPQHCSSFCPYEAICRVTDELRQEGEKAVEL